MTVKTLVECMAESQKSLQNDLRCLGEVDLKATLKIFHSPFCGDATFSSLAAAEAAVSYRCQVVSSCLHGTPSTVAASLWCRKEKTPSC